MTLRCPKCKTPSLLSPSEVGEVGRLERCPNCETTWLARHYSESAKDFGHRDRRPMTRREPPIIEGEYVPPIRATSGFHGQGAAGADFTGSARLGRLGLAVGATALVLLLLAVILLTPAVSSLPRLVGFGAGDLGAAREDVSNKVVSLRGTGAIPIEGQPVNRSGGALDVPAVRVALKEEGTAVYSWPMEPTLQRVAAESLAERGGAAALDR